MATSIPRHKRLKKAINEMHQPHGAQTNAKTDKASTVSGWMLLLCISLFVIIFSVTSAEFVFSFFAVVFSSFYYGYLVGWRVSRVHFENSIAEKID